MSGQQNALRDIQMPGGGTYEAIVASIGFDWFSPDHKMHYSGPGASWWAGDVVENIHRLWSDVLSLNCTSLNTWEKIR